MIAYGLTMKFTLEELRDNISNSDCGVRGQSRKFHQFDDDLNWNGRTHHLKVPVVYLEVFCDDIQTRLIKGVQFYMYI